MNNMDNKQKSQLQPHETFVAIGGNRHLLLKLNGFPVMDKFEVQVDLVFKESRKIAKHLAIIHHVDAVEAMREARLVAVEKLKQMKL